MIGGAIILLLRPGGISFPGQTTNTSARVCAGLVVKAPARVDMRISGSYVSVLPDGQQAVVEWDDGTRKIDYVAGSNPGQADTAFSANKRSLSSGASVTWDLYDLSEAGNDLGHGNAEDNLGLQQCNNRIYTLLMRNWTSVEGSTGDLLVGAAAINEWDGFLESGGVITLPQDSALAIVCDTANGMPVNETNCMLKVTASGGNVVYGMNYSSCSN